VGRWLRPRRWAAKHWTPYRVSVNGHTWVLVSRRHWGVTAWCRLNGDTQERVWAFAKCYGDLNVIKRRQKSAEQSNASHVAAVDSTLFSKLHPLVAHCACTRYDDGEPRKPGWFTIKTMGAAWVIEVKDPDTCQRLVVVQQTLDDALSLASLLMESEEAPWEVDPWLSQQQAKSKKK
jgi:hypothetical protein